MEEKKWIPFNLNDRVKVKLNDKGYQIWADFYNGPIIRLRLDKKNLKTAEDYKKHRDIEGYVEFQAHEFMRVFGENLGYSFGDVPFETTIFIENKV